MEILIAIKNLFDYIIPILVLLGVVYFVWGVVQYVIGDGEEAKTKGRDHVISGIIGLAVIASMWGLVGVVSRTFDLEGYSPRIPNLVATTTTEASGSTCDVLDSTSTIQTAIGYVICLIQNSIIPLMFALAVAFFIWGIVQFVILGAGDETKRTQGREHMIWGVIALTVMLSVWTLVSIVGGTFFKGSSGLPGVKPPTTTR